MKLDQKIRKSKVRFLLTGEIAAAYETALYYLITAMNKKAEPKIADACFKAVYWLKKAGVEVGSGVLGVEELEKLLVEHKAILQRQDVGARRLASVKA